MSDANLVDLTPNLGVGWLKQLVGTHATVGYYVHRGRVYLQGRLINARSADTGAPAPTTTLLSGLPIAIRPAADVAVTFVADLNITADPATPGVNPPITFAATITTGGDVVLGSLPAYIIDTPDPTVYKHYDFGTGGFLPDFTTAVRVGIIIANVSWEIDAETDDGYATESLGPYLATSHFVDSDSTIGLHSTRVHLGGHVAASRINPYELSPGVPVPYRNGLNPDGVGYEQNWTTAIGPGGWVVGIEIDSDGSMWAITDENADDAAGSAWYQPGSWADSNNPMPGVTTHTPFGGGIGQDRRVSLAPPHPPGTSFPAPASWDFGSHFGPCGLDILSNPIYCPSLGDSGSVMLTIADVLAMLYPEPDWFMIAVNPDLGSDDRIYKGVSACDVSGTGCGPYVAAGNWGFTSDAAFSFVDAFGNPAHTSVTDTSAAVDVTAFEFDGRPGGWVKRPSGGYARAPSHLETSLLWQPGEINTFTMSIDAQTNRCDYFGIDVVIYPFWERRHNNLFPSDVLDLSSSGWQALLLGVAPGAIVALPGATGIRHRRGRIVGRDVWTPGTLTTGSTIPGGGSPNTTNVLTAKTGNPTAGAGEKGIIHT